MGLLRTIAVVIVPNIQGSKELAHGPMFVGKSTELVERAFWARDVLRRNILVLKPAYETAMA